MLLFGPLFLLTRLLPLIPHTSLFPLSLLTRLFPLKYYTLRFHAAKMPRTWILSRDRSRDRSICLLLTEVPFKQDVGVFGHSLVSYLREPFVNVVVLVGVRDQNCCVAV